MKRIRFIGAGVLPVLMAISLATCSGGGGSTTSSPTAFSYFGTQSPGDAWSWTITKNSSGSGTFSAVNNTTGNQYSGDVVTLSNKFLKLTVTATNDSGAVGGIAYAIEFPNTALIVKPAGSNSAPVIASAQGTCPPQGESYNWIKIPNGAWNSATDPAFGVATTSGSGNSFTFSITSYLLDGSPFPIVTDLLSRPLKKVVEMSDFSCSNGVISGTDTGMPEFGVTPSGVLIADQGSDGGIIGMLQPPANIGGAAILQQGREFRGFVFMTHPPEGQTMTEPVWAHTLGDSLITAGQYTNFVSGTEDLCPAGDSCASLSLDSEVAPGEFSGTLTDNHAGAHAFTLMINEINGKYMVFGFSQEQAGSDPNALYPYLFLVMEQ
jgi:hypothetical protein